MPMLLQSDLVDLISKDLQLNKDAVRKVIRKFVKYVVIALENETDVRTTLGTFSSEKIRIKEIHNFQTGKREKMFPKKRVSFSPSLVLIRSLDKINAKLYDEFEKQQKESGKDA